MREANAMSAEQNTDELFGTMPVPKAVQKMAIPAVVSQLIVLIYNLADTFFVGQTNDPYMVAGVSLILPVFNLTLAVANLFGSGGGALLPKLLARDDTDEASRSAAYCLRFGALSALAFSAIIAIFMRPILNTLGASENTYVHAKTYVTVVLVYGALPTMLSNVLSNLIRSLGLSREAAVGVALGGVLNIVLDPLFMFVLLPKGSEVLGVAVATLISNCISCIYCLLVFFKKQKVIKPALFGASPRKENRSYVYAVGFPGAAGGLLFDADYMVLDRLISSYGETALAAIGIVLKAERIPQQVGLGLCQAMVPLVAFNYERKDFKRLKEIMRCTLAVGAVVAVVSLIIYELLPGQIVRLFIRDAETLAIGTSFLRIRSLAAVIMFFCFFGVHFYQGVGDGKKSLLLALMRWVGLNIPMMFILNAAFGMYGTVWAQVVSDVISVIITFIVLRHDTRRWEV